MAKQEVPSCVCHHLKNIAILAVLTLLSPLAGACIWQNGSAPYWPSTNIEVCFNAPSEVERRESIEMFNQTRVLVRNAYETMNPLSDFKFVGFGYCSDERSTSKTPKIRVDLTQESVIPEARSIGPSSATSAVSLIIPYRIVPNGSSTNAKVPVNSHNLTFGIIHETMHLLGFRHDNPRTMTKYFSQLNDVVLVGDFDANSVMTITPEEVNRMSQNRAIERPSPFMSEQDRNCLQQLARRQIVPGSPATAGDASESAF